MTDSKLGSAVRLHNYLFIHLLGFYFVIYNPFFSFFNIFFLVQTWS